MNPKKFEHFLVKLNELAQLLTAKNISRKNKRFWFNATYLLICMFCFWSKLDKVPSYKTAQYFMIHHRMWSLIRDYLTNHLYITFQKPLAITNQQLLLLVSLFFIQNYQHVLLNSNQSRIFNINLDLYLNQLVNINKFKHDALNDWDVEQAWNNVQNLLWNLEIYLNHDEQTWNEALEWLISWYEKYFLAPKNYFNLNHKRYCRLKPHLDLLPHYLYAMKIIYLQIKPLTLDSKIYDDLRRLIVNKKRKKKKMQAFDDYCNQDFLIKTCYWCLVDQVLKTYNQKVYILAPQSYQKALLKGKFEELFPNAIVEMIQFDQFYEIKTKNSNCLIINLDLNVYRNEVSCFQYASRLNPYQSLICNTKFCWQLIKYLVDWC